MIASSLIPLLASFCAAAAATLFVLLLVPRSMPLQEATGERGDRRRAALSKGPWLKILLSIIKAPAFRISSLRIPWLREPLTKKLAEAGYPAGLDADELMAASVLCAVVFSIAGSLFTREIIAAGVPGSIVGFLFGIALPWFKVDDTAKKRIRRICRELPRTIDMLALAMRAGLDFPKSLSQVAGRMPDSSPLKRELSHMLYELTLGHTRAVALGNLARRAPASPVRQFTAAVIQSERQGTPLARVLEVQGTVLRTRRSQAAEQAAARAAVLILGPLMLIFACVFTILLGPFVIKWLRGELF